MDNYGQFSSFDELRGAARAELHAHLFSREHVKLGSRRYRFEHCLRVAKIGAHVARKEDLDAEELELACLLHDIGKYDAEFPVDHGRAGALIATDVLCGFGLSQAVVGEIAQGIAMHTDGLCNIRADAQGSSRDATGREYMHFDSAPSVLARSVGDCDNIDRFSVYRIYDTLRYFNFLDQSTSEQIDTVNEYLSTLERQREYTCATDYAQKMWIEALDYQKGYFERLLAQIS
ncbi:MAG: HD domain-containing protein [Actinomycetaceae bacterium]|nr:HD domain-containing protein [Arcanobacterium sp.]MDD7505500.1 HD domain-containing protein [Actinomycetaceae bacterium]MDY6143481.1 HD domain-containing protein [Arcanobacterium sp.]